MEMDNWPYKLARLINVALKFMAEASSQVSFKNSQNI